MFAPYAKREVFWITLVGAGATALTAWLAGWWAFVPAVLAAALLTFYRDPPRQVRSGDKILLAPADGKIMSVERDYRPEPDEQPQIRIVIFLSVFNVHINRAPCRGRVIAVEHTPGLYLNALKAEATTRNANTLVIIDPQPPLVGPVYVRQVAGLLAKRIVCTLRPGDHVEAGQRYGMIKLGSQTEVRLPADPRWQIWVEPGQKVRAGLTVLARCQEPEERA